MFATSAAVIRGSVRRKAAQTANLAAKLDHTTAVVPDTFFNMHRLGIADTVVPTVNHAKLRVWDNWGFNSLTGDYTGGANDWAYAHTSAGVFRWNMFDRAIDNLQARGKTDDLIFTILHHQSVYAKPSWVGAIGTSDYYTRLSEYVTALLVRANGRIRIWGIMNEPNGNVYTDAQIYTIYQTIYPIIKAASSDFYVLSPEYQGNGTGNITDFLGRGGGNYFDIVGLHFYGPMGPQIAYGDGGVHNLITQYKFILTANGQSTKAIWDTESSEHSYSFGGGMYATRAEQERAYISQKMPLNWALGVDRWYYYAWDSDSSVTGKLNDGVGNSTVGSGKNVAGVAWDLVRGWLLGKVVGTPTYNVQDVSIPLTGSGGYVGRIAWAYKDASGTTFTAGTFTRAILADGTEYSIGGAVTSFPLQNLSVLLDNQAASGGATLFTGSATVKNYGLTALSPGLLANFPNIANGAWSVNGTTKTASQPDVNGGTTGEGILETAATGQHQLTSGVVTKAAANINYTFVSRLKANNRTALRLVVWRGDFSATAEISLNLSTGAMTAISASAGWANGTLTPTDRGNGWWDFSWSFTIPSTVTSFVIQYNLQNPDGTSSYLGSTSAGYYINGFSLN